MKLKLKCPICGKRACDASALPEEKIYLEMKCPNCRKIVVIPFYKGKLKRSR